MPDLMSAALDCFIVFTLFGLGVGLGWVLRGLDEESRRRAKQGRS